MGFHHPEKVRVGDRSTAVVMHQGDIHRSGGMSAFELGDGTHVQVGVALVAVEQFPGLGRIDVVEAHVTDLLGVRLLMAARMWGRVSDLTLFTHLGFFGYLYKCIIFGTIDKSYRRCGRGFPAVENS